MKTCDNCPEEATSHLCSECCEELSPSRALSPEARHVIAYLLGKEKGAVVTNRKKGLLTAEQYYDAYTELNRVLAEVLAL